MVVIAWAVNVALGEVTMMDMHMTCEVAVVVHGTVQDNGWFRQYARGSRSLRNRHQHSLKQKRTHRQEHECSCEREKSEVPLVAHCGQTRRESSGKPGAIFVHGLVSYRSDTAAWFRER